MYFLNIKVLYILYILSFQYNNNFYFKCMGNRTEAPKKKNQYGTTKGSSKSTSGYLSKLIEIKILKRY